METARVDVRKLQLLNDRINQCLDALNLVRLSTYGLSHAPATVPFGAPATTAPPFDPRFAYGGPPIVPGLGNGISHTPYAPPLGAGFTPGIPGGGVPFQLPFPSPFQSAAQFPIWNSPVGHNHTHTGIGAESFYPRPLWADPLLAARVVQTFPYVQFGAPPMVAIY